jgi:hypothetical protein
MQFKTMFGSATDAPARPRLTVREIKHGVIVPVEPDVTEFENLFHQPYRIGLRVRRKIVIILLAGHSKERR